MFVKEDKMCMYFLWGYNLQEFKLVLFTVAAIITEGPVNTPGMVGENIAFTCTAIGIPLPNVTWMDEDDTMLMGSDMVINGFSIQSTLKLLNLRDEDFDNYTCTVTNKFGGDNVTALLGSE